VPTAVLSLGLLLNLVVIWERRSALSAALHHFPVIGSASLQFLEWKAVNFFNVFLSSLLLVTFWMRHFQARAERRRSEEQRQAKRTQRGEGIWPPSPRM